MSEADKKGSRWPWILVPVGAVTLFFILRYCQKHMPPGAQPAPASESQIVVPAEPAPPPQDAP
jgi:hypothetical protein